MDTEAEVVPIKPTGRLRRNGSAPVTFMSAGVLPFKMDAGSRKKSAIEKASSIIGDIMVFETYIPLEKYLAASFLVSAESAECPESFVRS